MTTPPEPKPSAAPPEVQLTGANRSPEEKKAYGYLMANISMPGMGTWMAGQKYLGALQLLFALFGQLFTLLGFFTMLGHIIAYGTEDAFATPGILTAFSGLGLFLLAWLWALGTSWAGVQQARDKAFEARQSD